MRNIKLLLLSILIILTSCSREFSDAYNYEVAFNKPTTILTAFAHGKERNKIWLTKNEDASIAYARLEMRPVYDIPKNKYVYNVNILNQEDRQYNVTQVIDGDILCIKYSNSFIAISKNGYEYKVYGYFTKIKK
jgi:hypothetical protein